VLASRAEEFLKTDPDQEAALRRLLTLKLAVVPPEGEPARRQASREECTDAEWTLAARLADFPWRLVVMGEREADGQIIAEVAHAHTFDAVVSTSKNLAQMLKAFVPASQRWVEAFLTAAAYRDEILEQRGSPDLVARRGAGGQGPEYLLGEPAASLAQASSGSRPHAGEDVDVGVGTSSGRRHFRCVRALDVFDDLGP
jgi:hypothetical protein